MDQEVSDDHEPRWVLLHLPAKMLDRCLIEYMLAQPWTECVDIFHEATLSVVQGPAPRPSVVPFPKEMAEGRSRVA